MPASLGSVVTRGDRLASLRALRNRLARDLDACRSMRDVPALSRQLTDVLEQIAVLEAERDEQRQAQQAPPKTGLSEFERKLAERDAGTSDQGRTVGG